MEFETFIDKNTNLQFCNIKNHVNINYPLIQWCKQFLKPDLNFVEIGTTIGAYSFVFSQNCKYVYLFNNQIEHLQLTKELNELNNISIETFDDLEDVELGNIGFIVFETDDVKLLHQINFKNNYYPPFVIHVKNNVQEILNYGTSLGYKMHQISGCPGYFLGSDHPMHNIKSIDTNILKQYQNGDESIETLLSLMNNPLVGYEVNDKIIISNFPENFKNEALIRIYNHMPKIPYKNKINLNCPMNTKRVPNNPSIINLTNGDYLCNIRCSNYIYEPHFQFLEGNIHLSDHILLTLSPDFMVKKMVVLQDKTDNVYYDSFVKGIDDLRLIDQHRFICSHGNFNNHRTIDQCLGTFDEQGNVTKLIPLKGPSTHRHEKNWLPWIKNDELYIVYMFNPFMLYKVNEETGELTLIKELTLVDNFNVKGSAPFIPYKDGLLATVHHTTRDLSYMQRFVWMDKDFTALKYSKPFYFEQKGVEFTLGMCDYNNGGIIMAISIRDNYAHLKTIDYSIVDAYLGF